jgi:hypothetical protein
MKKLPLFALLAVGIALALGLAHLFNLRFGEGDVYPAYSTLRSDPLGAKALFESLDRLVAARRHFQPLDKLGEGRGGTLFYLGAERSDLRLLPDEFKQLESFAADGGRVVISLFPSFTRPQTNWFAARAQRQAQRPKGLPLDEDEFADQRTVPITERWGFEFGYAPLQRSGRRAYEPARAWRQAPAPLPEALDCHSALVFTNLSRPWRVIYAREPGGAVLMERRWGDGSLVLVADSFYFSNEALQQERRADLLAWFVGPGRRVVFDEAHLGVREEPGIATLARKYRLHGLFVALLTLAALFVWKNSVSFLPPHEAETAPERGDLVAGKDVAAGFVNLLRRNIRSAELLAVCVGEWKKTCARGVPAAKLRAMQAAIDAENTRPAKERDPVAAYRKLSETLARVKRAT